MLKWIAMFLMLVDHFAIIMQDLIPHDLYMTMRIIGRISFPIFVYYVVLGTKRTSNLKKYMGRLLIFATLSEVARRMFDVFKIPELNVIFSLLFYAVLYFIITELKLTRWISIPVATILALIVGPYIEYGYFGISIFVVLHLISNMKEMKPIYAFFIIPICFILTSPYGYTVQIFSAFAGILMFNGKLDERVFSKEFEKWAFYVIYPLQFIVFGLIYKIIV